jgi:hypothetical protein
MRALRPESGPALNFTGPRRMKHEQASTSACRLLHVVPLVVPSRVSKQGEKVRKNVEDRRPFALPSSTSSPFSCTLVAHRSRWPAPNNLRGHCPRRTRRPRRAPAAQARQGRELLPEREGRPPAQAAHRRQAHPGRPRRNHSGDRVPEGRG